MLAGKKRKKTPCHDSKGISQREQIKIIRDMIFIKEISTGILINAKTEEMDIVLECLCVRSLSKLLRKK